MSKISRIAQAQADARTLLGLLKTIGVVDETVAEEIRRVENLGLPLAEMIERGYVERVSAEAADMLAETLASALIVRGHGMEIWANTSKGTVLEYRDFDTQKTVTGVVVGFTGNGFSAIVTNPGTLVPGNRVVSLLWAPETTRIITAEEVTTVAATESTESTRFTKDGVVYELVQHRGKENRPVVRGMTVYGRGMSGGSWTVERVDGPIGPDGFPRLVVTRTNRYDKPDMRTMAGPDHLEVSWVPVPAATLPGKLCFAGFENGSAVEWMVRVLAATRTERSWYVLYQGGVEVQRSREVQDVFNTYRQHVPHRDNLEASLSY